MRDQRRGIGNGILLIALGVLFMIDRQGYADFGRLWPVILIVLGTTSVLFPRDTQADVVAGFRGAAERESGLTGRRRSFGGLWLILVGGLFLLHENHMLSIRQSWPLFIVAGGLAMIFGNHTRRAKERPEDPQIGGQPS